MLNDPSTGLTSIVYNDFDQPVTMNKTGNVSIHYRYSTAGQRMVKILPGGARQYYLDNVVLNQTGRPIRYTLDEGYAELLVNNQIVKYIENKDWLGTIRMVRDYSEGIVGFRDHYPYGLSMPGRSLVSSPEANRYQFTGHESDGETTLDYHGARYYSRVLGRYMSVDPLAVKFPFASPYNYALNNPINLIDPDGKEPIKSLVGTVAKFRTLLDNSPRQVGAYAGTQASNYLKSLGNTEFNWKQMRPLPTETGYFNNKEGRYIYTEVGGWVDMAHFMFYAGKAYQYKLDGKENPIGEAVQDGYMQEVSDKYAAKHSAYSYEDLPSDKFGADFGVNHFNPNSKQTFGEQLGGYLNNVLKATDPRNAPNYDQLPTTEPQTPTRINTTTTPVYTEENP